MNKVRRQGHQILNAIELFGLVVIAISTVIALGIEISSMIEGRRVALADLLLIFIYLGSPGNGFHLHEFR